MALLWCDSFDYATDDLAYKYAVTGSPTTTTGKSRWSGKRSLYDNSYTSYVAIGFTPTDEVYVGLAQYADNGSTSNNFASTYSHLKLGNEATSAQMWMKFEEDSDVLGIGTGTGSVVDSFVCPLGVWNYLEFRWKYVDGSNDIIQVKLNGLTVVDETGDYHYSGSFSVSNLYLKGQFGVPIYYQDLYICDASGSTNNSWLGDIRVQAIRPSGAGNYSQFTPLSGSNYENVDDTDIDGDTSYVSGTTVGVRDTYTMEDISSSRQIFAVASNIVAQKATAGASFLKPTLRISSTDYEKPALGFGVGYTSQQTIWETSPATASEFTASEVNALESGFTLYASTTTTTTTV